MDLKFVTASLEDLPKIMDTYNATISSRMVTADLEPVSADSRRTWFEAHVPGKRPLWLVIADQQYAGWISFNSFYGRPAYDATAEISIYLEENQRGKGLGRTCLQKAIEVAPELGIENLLGFIFGHNTISLRLFERFGFHQWGCLPGVAKMDGVARDLVILGRKINDRNSLS